jgi:hypothetical protein
MKTGLASVFCKVLSHNSRAVSADNGTLWVLRGKLSKCHFVIYSIWTAQTTRTRHGHWAGL